MLVLFLTTRHLAATEWLYPTLPGFLQKDDIRDIFRSALFIGVAATIKAGRINLVTTPSLKG